MSQRLLLDDVVAIVGDDAILRSDIEIMYQQAQMEGAVESGDLMCHLFERLLVEKLMVNQAKMDSVVVSDNEVMTQVDARINQYIQYLGGQDKLEEYFDKPLSRIKLEQVEYVRTQRITEKMKYEITKNIKITPSEIRNYFSRMPEDSIPYVQTQYELSQIVIYPKVDQTEIDRIKSKLRDFQKQVSEGRDFSTLAVLYSDDPGSASRGGDLGWTPKSGLVPEFASAAFNLQEKGKVSKIVETEFGYHIIQLIDRKGDRINCRHILMKPKLSADNKNKAIAFLDTVLTTINDGKVKFEEAAARFSMDKDSRANGGVIVNKNDGSHKFLLSDIPAEIAKAIQGLKVGEISKPFMMIDEKNKETIRIVMLKKKHDPHRANMRDDYSMLQTIMENKKRNEAIDNWVRQRQNEVYINISPEWQKCDFQYKGWVK
ncbi:MAG: peptidylprolyl isomerase [Bacteroidales bacterium]|nr:peptidylprolyl isomerase [Bacteroidales bacterium]